MILQLTLTELFSRWEKVWHEKAYDLAANCVSEEYIAMTRKRTQRVKL